jgi:hypothetical protein
MDNNQRRNGSGDFHDSLFWLNCELVVARSAISLSGSESTLATVEFESLSNFCFVSNRRTSSNLVMVVRGTIFVFWMNFRAAGMAPGGSFLFFQTSYEPTSTQFDVIYDFK